MPRLVIKKGEGVGRDHALSGAECVVGRDADAHFVIEDHLASRRHFRIIQDEGAYFVEDLGSTNGTLVNGRKCQRLELADGDLITAGGTDVQFVQKDLLGGAIKPVRAKAAPEAPQPASSPEESSPEKTVPVVQRRRRHIRRR